ncbi:SCO family protein [Thiosulfativibrio zosterae]|uniref:Thioredoxin domain-containing protein n=1 Tax=Thiosulfativibrio zosterae TaxID=2675053 RepID=A0A6F8PKC8_9GAMM|nr:SCO family protein [Thiosulfativibrio zosterae]BBP42514.1 hypothetical protein THMIRHAT_02600 [Thiosulfativibrio zosterae]
MKLFPSKAWIFYILTALAFMAMPVVFFYMNSAQLYGLSVDRIAPDFILKDTQGNPHTLSQHRGRFVYLYFGYLNCNEVCHNQVGVMFNLHHQSHMDNVDFIFITMDPKRDSNKMLNQYFNQFGDNFYALTAESMAQIQVIANQYQAYFFAEGKADPKKDYEISHPGNIFLIDPDGRLKVIYPNQFLRYDNMLTDLKFLNQSFNPQLNSRSQP